MRMPHAPLAPCDPAADPVRRAAVVGPAAQRLRRRGRRHRAGRRPTLRGLRCPPDRLAGRPARHRLPRAQGRTRGTPPSHRTGRRCPGTSSPGRDRLCPPDQPGGHLSGGTDRGRARRAPARPPARLGGQRRGRPLHLPHSPARQLSGHRDAPAHPPLCDRARLCAVLHRRCAVPRRPAPHPGSRAQASQGRGGPGVVAPTLVDGEWQAHRDIVLGRSIPGHPGC